MLYKILTYDWRFYLCRLTSKVIIFQEVLQFQKAIVFYYNKQIDPKGTNHVPPSFHMAYIINYSLNILSHFVTMNVLNQFLNHW